MTEPTAPAGRTRWAASKLTPQREARDRARLSSPLHAPPPPLSPRHTSEKRLGRAVIGELLLEGEDSLFRCGNRHRDSQTDDPVTALTEAATAPQAPARSSLGSEQHSRLHKASRHGHQRAAEELTGAAVHRAADIILNAGLHGRFGSSELIAVSPVPAFEISGFPAALRRPPVAVAEAAHGLDRRQLGAAGSSLRRR